MSELSFEQMFEESSFKRLRTGEAVTGQVIGVKEDEIILSIAGSKSEGIITRSEFTNEPGVDLRTKVQVGDELEAKVLDIALILHAEHGGGNNSTFTTHVVTSSGTDTYSSTAASIGSLKGPRHGGANLKVQNMFADLKSHVDQDHWDNEDEIITYLKKVLNKEAFDHAGLIYGMGHAVYTNSDPRAVILKKFAKQLSEEKGMQKEFALYELVESEAGQLIMNKRKMFKPVCANVDFYSGFVYTMLGIPEEMFTPMFATSRISGWCAHRLEELVNAGKIIRPAYKYVGHHRPYVDMDER